MTSLTDEMERFRQQMLEDARQREVELVRLGAELEKIEQGLITQLRSLVEVHDQRRDQFVAELRAFAGRFGDGGQPTPLPPGPHPDRRSRAVSWTAIDPASEAIAN
jgi:hypothetical protein